MFLTTKMLLERLSTYGNPFGKIKRMVEKEEIFPVCKGLYVDERAVEPIYLAGAIYAPSYISFNYALGFYGFIPEAVYSVTSATTQKGKKKSYTNMFGTFTYCDIPIDAYPFGVRLVEENGYSYIMATKEKALCDKLYELPVIHSQKDLVDLLFDDMRIDPTAFSELNREDIYFIAPRYHSTNLNILVDFLKRSYHE